MVKRYKVKLAGAALAIGVVAGLTAAPAFGDAEFNHNGANCHGVLISGIRLNPAQFAKSTGTPVKQVQVLVREYCAGAT